VSRRLQIIPGVIAVVLALAVAVVALASSTWRSEGHPAASSEPTLALAGQTLRFAQTRTNQALIRLPNAKPGQIARGTTKVSVTGAQARVSVGVNNLSDVAGPNGGKLVASRRLWIDVRCVARPCPSSPVGYRGPLALMGTRSLGTWAPGTVRTYGVRVWLLRGGMPPSSIAGDNVFQGSRAGFGLTWRATATS
jgi:hypothetical protein